MRTLDLENMNLKEMSKEEMMSNQGGNPLVIALAVYFAYEIAGNPSASWKAFKQGWNSIQ